MRKSHRRLDRDQALDVGIAALTFLAEDRDRLIRFLDLTGISPAELRTQAQSPVLLAAVLDHLLADESSLLVFTASAGIDPEMLGPVRDLLQRAA